MCTTRSTSAGGWPFLALLILLAAFTTGCQRDSPPKARGNLLPSMQGIDKDSGPKGPGAVTHHPGITGAALGDGIFVGAPKHYGHLTVYPVLAKTQIDVGKVVSLHDALESGKAEVRELGGGGGAGSGSPANEDAPSDQQIQTQGDSAEVGKLAIENKGDVPVYVLAGTIVKGGKQDRQVGQDFIIGAKETVPIDAFCVEHGRWNGNRNGVSTGGKFEAVKQLANKDVRVAGQYKGNQSEVWSKVSEVNKHNKKSSKSDSLLATADDAELKKERDTLRAKVLADLDAVKPKEAVVGYAYAIGDHVAGVRWFAHHRVFQMFREVLVNTAIVDAITARASGTAAPKSPLPAETVASFVKEARKAPVAKSDETAADNVNEYKESEKAYGSKTYIKAEKAPAKKKVPMSHDFSAK